MKISTRLLSIFALLVVFVSCSKDDEDAKPSLEQAAISLSSETQVVSVPTAMSSSSDPYAQMATLWVAIANNLGTSLALFKPAAGANKSSELITPVNGRVNAGGEAVVYVWSDPQYGSVAYQIRDASTKYTFELFYKGTGDSGWYRYLYAEENKDKSSGYMVMYDFAGMLSDERNEEMFRWEWTRSGDDFTLSLRDYSGAFNMTIKINTKTKAGSITSYEDGEKVSEMTWDAQGKGTWKEYEGGEVVEEGSWS